MNFRLFLVLVLVFSLPACDVFHKNKKVQPSQTIKNAKGDVSYEGFVNRLRKAVETHDIPVLASMMSADFGYLLDPTSSDPGSGEGVWKYWDANQLWPEVNRVVHAKFMPFGNFMVAPSEFVTDPAYIGYRAGLSNINGSWKFVYFVSGKQETTPQIQP